MRPFHLAAGIMVAAAALAATLLLLEECDVCEGATSILLAGTVPGKCTLNVSADPQATNVPVTASGAQRILIGTILQDCNGNRSFTLSVSSMNCATAPAGGKMVSEEAGEFFPYSAEFVNPPTGNSTVDVTGLLASGCAGQIGRSVTKAHIRSETSTVYLNFTGAPDLGAGTYQDVVTISLDMQ